MRSDELRTTVVLLITAFKELKKKTHEKARSIEHKKRQFLHCLPFQSSWEQFGVEYKGAEC